MTTVLVTGGSAGLGLATVERLAASGNRVFAASRHPRASAPSGVTPIMLDVTDPQAAEHAIGLVVETAGTLDVLVNNAAHHVMSPVEEAKEEDVRQMFEVNLFGPLRLATLAIPVMRAQGHGRIINVTSISDVLPTPFDGWYSATKAALKNASAVLNAELHCFGISVTVVAPGLFRTAMAEARGSYELPSESNYYKSFRAFTAHERHVSWPTALDPEDFAAAIEHCICAKEAPARVVVGGDAQAMDDLVRSKDADEYAELLRGFLARIVDEWGSP